MCSDRIIGRCTLFKQCNEHDSWRDLDWAIKEDMIVRIEHSCYLQTQAMSDFPDQQVDFNVKKNVEIYSSILYKILSNLDVNFIGSAAVISSIINCEIDIDNMANMSSAEINPIPGQKLRDEIAIRKTRKIELKVSREEICKKCGKNETISRSFQGRASDESETLSIECIHCRYVWLG